MAKKVGRAHGQKQPSVVELSGHQLRPGEWLVVRTPDVPVPAGVKTITISNPERVHANQIGPNRQSAALFDENQDRIDLVGTEFGSNPQAMRRRRGLTEAASRRPATLKPALGMAVPPRRERPVRAVPRPCAPPPGASSENHPGPSFRRRCRFVDRAMGVAGPATLEVNTS